VCGWKAFRRVVAILLSIEKVAFRKRAQKTLAACRTNVHVRRQNQALEVGKSGKDDGS